MQNQSFSFLSSFRRRLRISRIFHGIPQNPLMVLRDSGSYSSFSYSVLHSAAACGYPKVSTDFLRVQMADIADFRNNTAESINGTQGLLLLLFLLILCSSFRRRLRISRNFNRFPAGTTHCGINPSLSSHHSAAACGYRGFSKEHRIIH